MKLGKVLLFISLLMVCFQMNASEGMSSSRKSKKGIKETTVSDFSILNNDGPFNVTHKINRDSAGYVLIYGRYSIVDNIELKSEGKSLTIRFDKKVSSKTDNVKIIIYSSNLEEANNNGSGYLNISSNIETTNFKLVGRGSGDISVSHITSSDINIRNLSSGNIVIDGESSKTSFLLSGSGDIRSESFNSDNISIRVIGSGNATYKNLNCTNVDIDIAGSGDVIIKGKAQAANYKTSGSGNIIAANMIVNNINAVTMGSGDVSCHAEESIESKTLGSGEIRYRGNPAASTMKRGSGSVKKD